LFNQCFFYRIKINSKAITNLDLFVKKNKFAKSRKQIKVSFRLIKEASNLVENN